MSNGADRPAWRGPGGFFLTEESSTAFQKDRVGTIAKAEKNWRKLVHAQAGSLQVIRRARCARHIDLCRREGYSVGYRLTERNLATRLGVLRSPIRAALQYLSSQIIVMFRPDTGYYSGHPIACAVALENLRILRDEKLVTRVREDIGPYFQSQLRTLAEHPLVGEVRGVGLIGAVEMVANKATRRSFAPAPGVGRLCREFALLEGLVIRAVRDSNVTAPPPIISHAEVDQLIVHWRTALDLRLAELQRQGEIEVEPQAYGQGNLQRDFGSNLRGQIFNLRP